MSWVNLALASCVELRPVCEVFVADCTCFLCSPLSSIDTFLPTAVAKSSKAASRKLCWINLSYWLPDIKVAQFYFERNFSKKCHFQIISDVQWWTKKFHPFLDSTYQEWMIFAKIGDGSCYYLWNEICAGVITEACLVSGAMFTGHRLWFDLQLLHFWNFPRELPNVRVS